MAPIVQKTKSNRGKPYHCIKCQKAIKPGDEYYEWTPFRSYSRRKHVACGYPKRSETDTSKMASVYAAIESAEEQIAKAEDASDIASALNDVVQAVQDTAGEYQEAVDAMGSAGESGTSAERVEALESFAEEVESASSDIESEEWEADDDKTKEDEAEEPVDSEGNTKSDWLEELRTKATDALGELSI